MKQMRAKQQVENDFFSIMELLQYKKSVSANKYLWALL